MRCIGSSFPTLAFSAIHLPNNGNYRAAATWIRDAAGTEGSLASLRQWICRAELYLTSFKLEEHLKR